MEYILRTQKLSLYSAPARISKGQGAGARRAQCQNKKRQLALEPHKWVSTLTYDYLPSPL